MEDDSISLERWIRIVMHSAEFSNRRLERRACGDAVGSFGCIREESASLAVTWLAALLSLDGRIR